MTADILDPYLVGIGLNPDFNQADAAADAATVADLNDMIQDVLEGRGQVSMDDFLDALEHSGRDPVAWMNQAAGHMQAIVDNGVYVMNESGLYLPL